MHTATRSYSSSHLTAPVRAWADLRRRRRSSAPSVVSRDAMPCHAMPVSLQYCTLPTCVHVRRRSYHYIINTIPKRIPCPLTPVRALVPFGIVAREALLISPVLCCAVRAVQDPLERCDEMRYDVPRTAQVHPHRTAARAVQYKYSTPGLQTNGCCTYEVRRSCTCRGTVHTTRHRDRRVVNPSRTVTIRNRISQCINAHRKE